MNKIIFLIILSLATTSAFAAGGDPTKIPVNTVFFQIFNLACVLLLLGYLLRKTIKSHFATRKSEYTEQVNKAQEQKKTAEAKHRKIQDRLNALEKTKDESLTKAKAEAQALKQRILKDAETVAERLIKDAERTAHYEVERAVNELRLQLLDNSIEGARDELKAKIDNSSQKKLQSEFVEKIQVVQS